VADGLAAGAGGAVTGAASAAGATVDGVADGVAGAVRGLPSELANLFDEDDDVHYIIVDEDRYPESAQHIEQAQDGTSWRGATPVPGYNPQDSEVTIDRPGADFNRREALRGIEGRGGAYLDRDEGPPAVFKWEEGKAPSVKYIDASDNRGAGASIGTQLRGLDRGSEVTIVVG